MEKYEEAHEPIDATLEIAQRIEAGEPEEQLRRDFRDLANIHLNRYEFQEAIGTCEKGLNMLHEDRDLTQLLSVAERRLGISNGSIKPESGPQESEEEKRRRNELLEKINKNR
jgi:hypothetical protein